MQKLDPKIEKRKKQAKLANMVKKTYPQSPPGRMVLVVRGAVSTKRRKLLNLQGK